MLRQVLSVLAVGAGAIAGAAVTYRATHRRRDRYWSTIDDGTGLRRDEGASAVEYGLLVAAIAAVILSVAFGLGQVIKNSFEGASASIQSCPQDPAACTDPPPAGP